MQRQLLPKFSPNSDLRIPGEFESQDAIVLGCGQLIKAYPQTFVDLVSLLHERVQIFGVVAPELVKLGEILLGMAGLKKEAVTFLPLQTSSMWVRDFSPVSALDRSGKRVFMQFRHNHMRNRDDVGVSALFREHIPGIFREVDVHLEGGNLLSNGEGFSLSSKTIISQNSSRFSHADLAKALDSKAGVAQWACVNPLNGERTGHIDLLATFLSPNLVCIGDADPKDDPNNVDILNDLAKALDGFQTSSGKLQVVRVPMPYSGDTHFRSYNNVIFANGLLVIPCYPEINAKQGMLIRDLYSEWLPGWDVVLLDCEEISKKGGSLHCMTMNVPAPVSVAPKTESPSLEAPVRDEILPR